jgi:hypothetical protein
VLPPPLRSAFCEHGGHGGAFSEEVFVIVNFNYEGFLYSIYKIPRYRFGFNYSTRVRCLFPPILLLSRGATTRGRSGDGL